MSKLIVLRGLPGAGKSTYAEALYKKTGIPRVNKDLLREMFHFGDWSPFLEKMIINVEKFLVVNLLESGESVIVDDTNLNPKIFKMWEEIAKLNIAEFEVVDLDTGLEECLRRNATREGKISPSAIIAMAMRYKLKK